MSGFTAQATLDTSVHGVVVQTARLTAPGAAAGAAAPAAAPRPATLAAAAGVSAKRT